MKKIKTLLVDMDCILVDMLPPWLKSYSEETGTVVKVEDVDDYDLRRFCTNVKALDNILHKPGFFYDMEPMPEAVKYLTKLMEDGYDVVILTQPPRRAEFAVRDKRRWMKKYFPKFELANMIFAHRKHLVRGDLLIDDKPEHLDKWKSLNPDGISATIEWKYNRSSKVDWRFKNQKTAWKRFYEAVEKHNSIYG